MLREAHGVLSAQPPFNIGAISFLLVAIIGAIDFATGYELSFSIFYTIPVGIVSWYAGKRLGFLACIISTITWLAADFTAGHQYSNSAIPIWNAGVRLGFFVIILFLLDRLRRSLDLQELLAQQDPLTGIMNARTFMRTCGLIIDLAARYGGSMALGYLDLDDFKRVNDSLGHSAGDQVLKAVATSLVKRLRASDFCGRLGGDEFAILLPETDLAGAHTFFTGLRENLVNLAVLNRWPVGFSIGVAVFPSISASPDDAIHFADGLMYKVKNSGKNGILFEEYVGASRGA